MLVLMRAQGQAAPEPIEQEHAQRGAENVGQGMEEGASGDVMAR
jgi:hypothetical protein